MFNVLFAWRLKIFSCTYIYRNKCAFFENMVVTFILGTMITARRRTQGNFVQGGLCLGGLCRGGLCPRGFCPRGLCPRGLCPRVSLSKGSLSKGSLSKGSLSKGSLSKGSLSGKVSVQEGGLCHRHSQVRWKSGWHASYWNAFLFIFVLKSARSVRWKYERFWIALSTQPRSWICLTLFIYVYQINWTVTFRWYMKSEKSPFENWKKLPNLHLPHLPGYGGQL